jgi:hypothetical protein
MTMRRQVLVALTVLSNRRTFSNEDRGIRINRQ